MNTNDSQVAPSQAAWLAVAETRTGRMHREAGRPNEDAVHVRGHAAGGLTLALADGVGSGRRGDLASAAVVQHWVEAPVSADSATAVSAAQALLRGSEAALQLALPAAEGAGGSMAVVAWTWADGQVLIGHVGDCRAYLLRTGQVQALTRDHTYANLGLTPPAWRKPEDPARMVGGGMMGPADVQRLQLVPGDVLLLCSDGVHGVLGGADLEAAWAASANLKRPGADAARYGLRALALRVVRQARLAGGQDDVSVVVAAFKGTTAPDAADAADALEPCADASGPTAAPLAFVESVWPQDLLSASEPSVGPTAVDPAP